MFGVRLKEHLLEYPRFVLLDRQYSRYNDTGKFLVSGRILVFTRPIILFYSHKLYIQNDDNMSHIFFFISKMYSACSLSFFNYPYVSPNVQTKLLSILEPTHNLVLTKVSP